ncbi:MAG: hypothetical protein H7263_06480 [Candidatus Sericytochromatia bacterium]|nr:hypothetical protein [Candidatus Sericytochromatia bacterium]
MTVLLEGVNTVVVELVLGVIVVVVLSQATKPKPAAIIVVAINILFIIFSILII